MKFIPSLIFAASALEFASAFAPAFVPRTTATKAFMIDPSGLDDLAHAADAVRVVFLECNSEECAMAEGFKSGDHWDIQGGLPESMGKIERVLMIGQDGAE